LTGDPPTISDKYRLIPDNDTLHRDFASLGPYDVFVGRLRLKPSEENLVVDLLERGVKLLPSGLSQLCCRSKVMQAKLFPDQMIPGTRAITDLQELMAAINEYQRFAYTKVVTKKDRANAGMGINLWPSIEDVFNLVSLGTLNLPFVIQPFYPDCRDIRVIVLDDLLEAYWRDNPDNFRNNLHCGGKSSPADLSSEQIDLCRKVMARGKFPYAHLDLMVTQTGETYLAEINLRGGIKGARITAVDYRRKIDAIHQRYCHGLGL
jgi:glutathione synthase/RimK-type ligase-like ATP-grasp enzyme